MTPERWQLISRIFKSALSLDGEARANYVAGQCGADKSLRAEVEKLIDSHQRASAEDFIAGVAAEENAGLLIDNQELGEQQSHRLTKGQQLGAYVILDVLGEGGMGEVYLAKDSRLDRTVALKVLSEEISADRRRMQRFRQEARIASSLNQPNILTIYEFGDIGSLTFLATEFVDGDTLRHYIRTTKLKLPEILDISIQMLAALDVAHEAGIVHRDIKPENVMIRRRDSVVKVLDFGLAKLTEKGTSQGSGSGDDIPTEVKTVPGTLMGTVNYMSPEQTQAHRVDERTDIWSTGAIIHEMVTGTLPFKGTTTSHTIVQILEKDLAPLSQLAKEPVPPELERIVSKALAKNPDERYQTAKDMLIDLRSLRKRIDLETEMGRSSSPTTPRDAVAVTQTDHRSKQKRVLAITLIGMAIVAGVFFGISVWRASRAREAAPVTTPPAVPAEERTLAYWVTVQKFEKVSRIRSLSRWRVRSILNSTITSESMCVAPSPVICIF